MSAQTAGGMNPFRARRGRLQAVLCSGVYRGSFAVRSGWAAVMYRIAV